MMTTDSQPRLTAVTLGVRDFHASLRFYEALGFVRKFRATGDEIAFIDAGGVVLALLSLGRSCGRCGICRRSRGRKHFAASTLAWNCATPAEVDAAYARACWRQAPSRSRPPRKTDYGGYRGYFADPDGHALGGRAAPGFTFTADGRLILPD